MKVELLRFAFLCVSLAMMRQGCLAGEVTRSPSSTATTYVVAFSGPIEPDDAFKIKQHLASIPRSERDKIIRKRIAFINSKGGDLDEGMKIGRLLREFQIGADTAPNSSCLSACALAFLGGTSENKSAPLPRRVKYSTSSLGFHSFGVDTSAITKEEVNRAIQGAQTAMLEIVKYFVEMDGDPRLLEHMVKTPTDSFYYVGNNEALDYCIFVFDESKPAASQPTNPYALREFKPPTASMGKWSESRCKH